MQFLGLEIDVKNVPILDKTFIPMSKFTESFLKDAKKPLAVAVERNGNQTAVFDTYIHGTPEMQKADQYYVDRIVKFMLWAKGGYKVFICGDDNVANYIKSAYSKDGTRAFDNNFMERVYEKTFEVVTLPYDQKPQQNEQSKPLGRHTKGCRIGFDAGGSDRKVSAVVDGESIFSEETVWFPKITEDPDYHYDGILESMKKAAEKMERVDAIGVSSAGIYIDNRTMVASLFLKVPEEKFNEKVKDIYIRAAKEFGDVPLVVANDGDVTALAGAMALEDDQVLGIAMGTSEAVGYVDQHGNITGWLNELAFAPVDAQENAMLDEWSGDIGCGVKYFSQDGVIKLAAVAGIGLDENASPAEKLKVVQGLMEKGDPKAIDIYKSIGTYLGHALAFYAVFYNIKHVLLLGRVMSGEGGNLIINGARAVLDDEYASLPKFELHLPDEKIRRVGQSAAAASLPEIS